MKEKLSPALVMACLFSLVVILSSCLKDSCRHVYKVYSPVFQKLSALRASVQSVSARPVTHAGKMFVKDNWIFLNEQGKGLHVIDNSNPDHPVKTSFISIPGNIDMYVKDNVLYADLYCDLVAMDISNPKNIVVKKYLTKIFPEKVAYTASNNPDSINVATDWAVKDTVMDCGASNICVNCGTLYSGGLLSLSSSSQVKSGTGAAGSMARFAAVDNYMYTVSTSSLGIVDIKEAANPLFVQSKMIGWDIETIFPYNNRLFIGAGSSMRIYDVQNPVDPQQLAWTGHWCSGDPVVADDKYAYVTLHEANVCGSKVNQLEIYNLNPDGNPSLAKTYAMANPQGLSKDGNLLFICDEGLKIYDVSDPANLKLLNHYRGFETYDVIASNGIAYVVAKDGLYQYAYNDTQDIHLLSKLLQ